MMKKVLFILLTTLSVNVFAQNISDTLHVAHYDLNLDFTDFSNHQLYACANLYLVTRVPSLSNITLDLQDLTVDSVIIQNQQVLFNQQNNKLIIHYNSTLGDTTLASVYYHGAPVQDSYWGGFYYSGEYCYNMGVGFESYPHNFGRCWFPCLDVFNDKSSYTLHVRTQHNKMAICGGMLTDSLTLADSTRLWTWQLDQPIPTYLASLAVGPYRLYADTFQGMERVIPIEIYAQPNSVDNVAGSFTNLKTILRLYESLFGPYRWPRVGYVAVNFTSGAMEHACNIAYPNAAINGNSDNELLYSHELFHHWFGDLITCARAEEMWINEGFATFSEPLVNGLLNSTSTEDGYRSYLRDIHHNTLKDIVKKDGAHYALDNVPQSVTYGMHSYEKGGLIVHTLRYYMGDSLFFAACRSLLNQYAFQTVSSAQLFNHFSQASGLNLTDFYEGWVHQPGFLHFSIDSIVPQQGNNYRVYLQQKKWAANHFANSNRVDLTFVAANRAMHTVRNAAFSGQYGWVDVTLPFVPVFGIVDYDEHLADAVFDDTKTMTSGNWSPSETNCTVKLVDFPDSVLVRVEHNLVSPDIPENLPDDIVQMSDNHYWTINLAYRQDAKMIPQGTLKFRYQAAISTQYDYALIHGYAQDNVKLLYRATTADPWRIVPVTNSGNNQAGTLTTEFLASGQYCLAVGTPTAEVGSYDEQPYLRCVPNPAQQELNIQLQGCTGNVKADIYNVQGRQVAHLKLQSGHNYLNISNFSSGLYFIKVKTKKGKDMTERFIVR